MNKKIMSFVLAMVLSVGLGVSSAFAYSYEKYAQEFNSSFESGSGTSNTKTVNVGKASDLLGGNLTAVFNYYGGSLISCQSIGGQFQLYDSYGARFSVDNKGGAWNVNSVNLRTTDLAEMEKAGSAEEFLKGMGFTDEQLKVVAMNENGEILDTEGNPISAEDSSVETGSSKISEDWFAKAKETLASGVNYSASITMGTGMTGPSLTVSENGKAMAVYQTNPQTGGCDMTTLYRYDDNGFLCGVEEKTFEMKATENGTATLNATINYTKISYDSNGVRTDTKYKFANFSNDPEGTIANASIATPDKKELTGDEKAMVVSKTTYSANNSTLSAIDYTTNVTTYYANNQPSYGVNELGVTVELYKYTENGVIQAHFNANGTDNNGNKVGTTTLYDKWGRELFKATTGSPDKVFNNQVETDRLLKEYYDGIKKGEFAVADFEKKDSGEYAPKEGTGTSIMNVSIYADQILDTNNPAIMTNGFIDMKKVNKYLNSGSVNSIIKNNLSGFGYSTNDILNMLRFSNGTNTALAQTAITHSSWDADNIPESAVEIEGGAKEIDDGGEIIDNIKNSTRSGGEAKGARVAKEDTQKEIGTKVVAANGITYSNTILLGGAQAYTNKHDVISEKHLAKLIEKTEVYSSDPAVEGEMIDVDKEISVTEEELAAEGIDSKDAQAVRTYKLKKLAEKLGLTIPTDETEAKTFFANLENGIYEADGKTYAIVSAATVNLMEGSGFQSAEGEVFFVDITESESKETVVEAIKSGDKRVMFMGDVVREDVAGNLTMVMRDNYGGGFIQGAAIDNAKKEIQNDINVVSNIANKYDISAFDGMSREEIRSTEAYKEACDKLGIISEEDDWIVTNTLQNMGTFGGSFDLTDKNKGGLEQAWSDLKLLF